MLAVGTKHRSRHCNISGAIGEKADVARTSWKRLESLRIAAAVARLHGGELTLEDNRPGLKSVIALPRGGPLQSAG